MQPSNFVPVRPDSSNRKDEWINSRLDRLALSRKLTEHMAPNDMLDKRRVISSQMKLTDRAFRMHSILSHYDDWGDRLPKKSSNSFQWASSSKGFTLNQNAVSTAKKSVDSDSEDRIFTSFSKRRRVQSEQKLRTPNEDTYRRAAVDIHSLKARITNATLNKRRVVNAIQLVADGIRWKLVNCFLEIAQGSDDPVQFR